MRQLAKIAGVSGLVDERGCLFSTLQEGSL